MEKQQEMKSAAIEATETENRNGNPGVEQELNTVLQLPSGAIARKLPLKGKDAFQFQRLATKDVSDALKWLIVRAYEIDGKSLTITDVLDMPFDDAMSLMLETGKSLSPSQREQISSL